MKKLFLTLGLLGCTLVSGLAQGTIAFGNSALTRITVSVEPGTVRNATSSDGIQVAVFFGPAGSSADQLVMAPGIATIGSTAGVLINAPSVFALPGTEPDQVVSLQIRGWNDYGWRAETRVAQVTLGETAGPGTVIWQTASGINANRFTPLLTMIPEPSTLAIGMLGTLFTFLRLRKSSNRQPMKKLLRVLGLAVIYACLNSSLCHAQGIIGLGNSALTKIQFCDNGVLRDATAADGLRISVYLGPAGSSQDSLQAVPGTETFGIGANPGVLSGSGLSTFALPGTDAGQVVSLQIRAFATGGNYTQTKVAQVTLASAPSPGAVIWQTSGGTHPNRFTPLIFYCPEPSTIALGAMAGAFLLFRVRKSSKSN